MARWFIVALLLVSACGSSRPSSPPITDGGLRDGGAGFDRDAGATRDAGPPDDPLELCPPGAALLHYSLAPLAMLPSTGALEIPTPPSNVSLVNAGSGTSYSVRFDVCEAATTLALRAILLRGESIEVPRFYVVDDTITVPDEDFIEIPEGFVERVRLPSTSLIVEGLDDAVAGDLAGLRIRAAFDSGLLVHGHDTFVAVARGRVTRDTIAYTSSSVIVGGLVARDVFANMQCAFGEDEHQARFRMGTANFTVDSCTFLGGGFTTGYRVHRLEIVDTNAALAPAEQAPVTFVTEAEIDAVMTYRWNHHNACDSFSIVLPHADYAASAAPAAGCGATVPNAPERAFDDDPNSPVAFRIRYHQGVWTDGTIPGCTHYLFCN